jgi:hypothetical protein
MREEDSEGRHLPIHGHKVVEGNVPAVVIAGPFACVGPLINEQSGKARHRIPHELVCRQGNVEVDESVLLTGQGRIQIREKFSLRNDLQIEQMALLGWSLS